MLNNEHTINNQSPSHPNSLYEENNCIFRSSRPEVFCKNNVLRNFAKFKGKHLCQSLFFNEVAGAAWNIVFQ